MGYFMSDVNTEEKPVVLSGTSPIQVRFIGWLVIVCASGFGGSIWWAAVMSTKLDLVISNQATQMAATKAVVEDVSRLKEWRISVDTVGSPTIVRRVDSLDKRVDDLSKQFEMHKITGRTTSKQP